MISTLEKRLLLVLSFLLPPLGFLLVRAFSKDTERAQSEFALRCAAISALSILLIICAGLLMHYY